MRLIVPAAMSSSETARNDIQSFSLRLLLEQLSSSILCSLARSFRTALISPLFSAYLNGITPIDLADFVKSPDFCSAHSLRTLRILFDDAKPLRPDHFDKLAKTCVNLNDFDFEGRLEAEPVSSVVRPSATRGLILISTYQFTVGVLCSPFSTSQSCQDYFQRSMGFSSC